MPVAVCTRCSATYEADSEESANAPGPMMAGGEESICFICRERQKQDEKQKKNNKNIVTG